MARRRYNNLYGNLGATQGAGDLTITFAAALTHADGQPVPTIAAPYTIDITVEPSTTNFEVERITAYTQGALTATVERGIAGAAKVHTPPAVFAHDPTRADLGYNASVAADIVTDFTLYPNGATPAETDSGQSSTVYFTQLAPIISSGKWIAQANASSSYADYFEIPFEGGANGRRIGAEFTVAANDGGTSSIGLLLFNNYYNPGVGAIPIIRAHLAVVPGTGAWTYSICDGVNAHFTAVATGTFNTANLAYDGTTVWHTEIVIDEELNCAYIHLPDGSMATVTGGQLSATIAGISGWAAGTTFKSLGGSIAIWEHFATNGTASTFPAITRIWADAVPVQNYSQGVSSLLLSRITRAAFNLLTYVEYNPNALTAVNSPSNQTFADVDAVHLAITFQAPPSGTALIVLNAGQASTGGNALWSVASSTYASGADVQANGLLLSGHMTTMHLLTGLTPGTTYTFRWRHANNTSGQLSIFACGGTGVSAYGPAIMLVIAV